MKRLSLIALTVLLVLVSCATPTYVIDNSRLKHQAFDAMEVTAVALELIDREAPADLVTLFSENTPNIAVIKADKQTISSIVDTLSMNVVKVSPRVIIATTGTIETKEEAGSVIYLDDTHHLQVLVDSGDYWKGPVLIAAGEQYEGVEDIYTATHAGTESIPFTFYQNGILPLESTDAGEAYTGYQGISCSFGMAE